MLRCDSWGATWASPGAEALIAATGKCLAAGSVEEVTDARAHPKRASHLLDLAFELAMAAQRVLVD